MFILFKRMLGYQHEYSPTMLGIYNYERDDIMLGGFKDNIKRGWKWFKKTGKKVTNQIPRLLDTITKNKNLINNITQFIPDENIRNIVNKTVENVDKLKGPAEMLNKFINTDKVQKDLGMTYEKVKKANLGTDINERVLKNANNILKNLGNAKGMNDAEAKKFMRDVKYMPLVDTDQMGGTSELITMKTSPLLKALGYKSGKKTFLRKHGRLFLGSPQGALTPTYMVSKITTDKKKAGVSSRVNPDVAARLDSFFE